MTTNIMFLRDMNTSTKRDLSAKYGPSTILAKAMLVMLLFLLGTANGTWAWADDIHFVIINNSGEEVIEYIDNTGTATVHVKVKSPFATNFRFYVSEAEAVKDAKGETTSETPLGENGSSTARRGVSR